MFFRKMLKLSKIIRSQCKIFTIVVFKFTERSVLENKLPVFLFHGIACSAADFINIHPNISLGYILWDAGYDVWMLNARGTSYSEKHVRIDRLTNPRDFYNFR